MACSVVAALALAVLYIALAMNATSTVLPLWTTTRFSSADSDSVDKADFAAGLWGFCDDAMLNSDSDSDSSAMVSFSHCFFFHASTAYELPKLGTSDDFNYAHSDVSVCAGYSSATNATARLTYVQTFANLSAQPVDDLDRFLGRSCGGLGYSTLVFGFLSPVCGLLAAIMLTLGITCLRRRLWAAAAGKWLSVVACLATVITFLLWIAQAHPMSDASFGASFAFSAVAAALYMNAVVLAARYQMVESRTKPPERPAEALDPVAV